MINNYNKCDSNKMGTYISDYSLGKIKFRYLFIALIFIWLPSFSIISITNNTDANIILEIIFYVILVLWIYISFKISKIKISKIIGSSPKGFKWASALAAIFFTQVLTFSVISMMGLLLSNVSPSLVKNMLDSTNNFAHD